MSDDLNDLSPEIKAAMIAKFSEMWHAGEQFGSVFDVAQVEAEIAELKRLYNANPQTQR